MPFDDLSVVVALSERIVEALESVGYTYVALDLRGFRSGSMNEVLSESTSGSDDA